MSQASLEFDFASEKDDTRYAYVFRLVRLAL